MIKCIECGKDFELDMAKKRINRRYSQGMYEEYCPDSDWCDECLDILIRDELNITDEVLEALNG